jgi:hypothetical protein
MYRSMNARSLSVLLLGASLAACEQTEQSLPFSTAAGEAVSRPVPAEGGVVSTPAGASVAFPAGSLSGTTVSIAPVAAPSAAAKSGASVSSGFALEPAGTALGEPAEVALKFDPAAAGERAWLASVVNVTPAGTRELPNTRVDLATGVARTDIAELGTVAVVVPAPEAVVELKRPGSASRAPSFARSGVVLAGDGATDSVKVQCGQPDRRCSGVSVEASDNVLELVDGAAAIYPQIDQIDGALRVVGEQVTGQISLNTAFRAQLKSGRSAENVQVNLSNTRIEATASTTIREDGARIVISGLRGVSTAPGAPATASLTIQKTGAQSATIAVVRRFELRNSDGQLEPATVTVRFPVTIHQ